MKRGGSKSLTQEEKLAFLDREIRNLHEYCVAQGYEPDEIRRCAEPLLGAVRAIRRQQVLIALAKVALVLAVLIGVYYYDPVYRLIWSLWRLATIQILPIWDWTPYHNQDCLIHNPYYVGNQLLEEDCELCENLENIPRIQNISASVLLEDHLKRDVPLIITDAIVDWPAKEKFSMTFLNQLYSTEPELKATLPCMFASNVRTRYGNPRALLSRAASGDITNWYAHWENCNKPAAKILRQFYRRPYFISNALEMAEPNWIFLASQYKGKKNKPADIALPMMWIGQLKGQMKVSLTPRSPCDEICPVLYNTLHEGDILVVTDMMWLLDYMPVGSGEMIAIGSGGYFD